MDLFNLFYYGVICGCLAVASGRIESNIARIVTGIVVGFIAATVLPYLRAFIGIG